MFVSNETHANQKKDSGYRVIFNWRHTNAALPAYCDMDISLSAIYDRILTANEILSLYKAGNERNCMTQPPSMAPTIAPTMPINCDFMPNPLYLWPFGNVTHPTTYKSYIMHVIFQ